MAAGLARDGPHPAAIDSAAGMPNGSPAACRRGVGCDAACIASTLLKRQIAHRRQCDAG